MTSPARRLSSAITLGLGLGAGAALGLGLGAAGLTLTAGTPAVAQPADSQARFATCDVVSIVEDLFASEAYGTARQAKGDELSAALQTMQQQLQRLGTELQLMPPSDPNRPIREAEAQRLDQALRAQAEQSSAEFQTFNATQIAQAFEIVAAKAQELAAEGGYEYLFMSREAGQPFAPEVGVTAVMQDILARPVLRSPEAWDLTAAVREALGVPDRLLEDAPDEAGEPDEGGDGAGGGAGGAEPAPGEPAPDQDG